MSFQSTRLGLSVMTLIAVLAILVGSSQQSPAHASGCGFSTVTATSSNTTGNSLSLADYGLTNPNTLVFATPNWGKSGPYSDHPLGVWWNGSVWAIFNQDMAAIPIGTSFNETFYTTVTSSNLDVFTHTATSSTITANYTVLDDPLANNNPNAVIEVTPNYNPGGIGATYDNHPIGVWYTGSRWAIFNQDRAAMPVDAAFNVMVSPSPGSYSFLAIQTASSANSSGDATFLSSPTDYSGPILFITPNYNPGGVSGTYQNHNIGVYYGTSWGIFNQDKAPMSLGSSFNVLSLVCPF